MEFQIATLKREAGECPIVSVSRKPMDLGVNVPDNDPPGYFNIYRQMRNASQIATTDFVAQVEDDVLYSRAHFTEYRPPLDAVSYNRSRWSLFAWDGLYSLRNRISNCTLIAPREYLLEALEERLAQWPHGAPDGISGEVGRPDVDAKLKVTPRNKIEWWSSVPVVQLNHIDGTDPRQKEKWKKHGEIRAYDIPVWGRGSQIVKDYYEH
jgi:hypothetical protein